jgi:hypothetical protein
MGAKLLSDSLGSKQSNANDQLGQIREQQLAASQQAQQNLQAIQPQTTEFGQALAANALGKGNSIANAQMQLAAQKNLQQQLSAAQANRGTSGALSSRNAAMAGARGSADIAGQAGVMRLQEQQQQQNQFQNYLGSQQQYQLGALSGAGNSAAQAADAEAKKRASDSALMGGLLQTGGSLAGMAFGGPAGAAVGGMAGGMAAQAVQPDQIGGSSSASSPSLRFNNMSNGGAVEAPEVVDGDSPENDIVPTMLSGGEVVVPKSIVEKGGKAAGSFVDALKQHMELKEKIKKMSYGDVLAAKKGK